MVSFLERKTYQARTMHLSISAAAAITLAAVPAAAEVYIKEQFDRVSLHRHLEDGAVRRGRRDEADSSSSYFFGGPGPGTLARRLGHVEIYADYILVATWKNEKIDDAAMTPTMQIPATESSTVDSRKTVLPTLPLFSVPPPHPGRCPLPPENSVFIFIFSAVANFLWHCCIFLPD